MVGPEYAAGMEIEKGAAKVASDALGEDPSIQTAIEIGATKSAGLARAAELRGRRAAVRQAIILQLWRPLARMVGVSKDYFEGDGFASDMADRLSDVPEDQLIAPPNSVAFPAMQ